MRTKFDIYGFISHINTTLCKVKLSFVFVLRVIVFYQRPSKQRAGYCIAYFEYQ
jgi:hypothetical protein